MKNKNRAAHSTIITSFLLVSNLIRRPLAGLLAFCVIAVTSSLPFASGRLELVPTVSANAVHFDLSSGNMSFNVSPATVNQITSNDDWGGVASVQAYFGQNLTATHGVDPQTVLTAEFTNSQLPNMPTQIAANKGNPSAFNAGGVAEFDSGTYLAVGLQGNVQANPYLVFYLNTIGRTQVTVGYTIQDIDGGSNDAVSRVALQYRVGENGNFINLPDGYIADATDGGVAGRTTVKSVLLPPAANNKPKVQVRLITTNAANGSGGSTPDEWIGVNNVAISSTAGPTAASVPVSGRITDGGGRGIRNALVTMQDMDGNVRTALTGPFGYYCFMDVQAGAVYIFSISGKRFRFSVSSQVRTILDSATDVDFVADN